VAQIPHGAVRRTPLRHELTADEVTELRSKAAAESLSAQKAASKFTLTRGAGGSDEDSSDDEVDGAAVARVMSDPAYASLKGVKLPPEVLPGRTPGGRKAAAGAGVGGSATAGGGEGDGDGEEEEEDGDDATSEGDAEDLEARASDLFLIAATTEDDHSTLEVYCYSTADGSLYVHHDIALPALPLCMAWMDYAGTAAASTMIAQCGLAGEGVTPDTFAGSYAAVGTFKPDIEIWNLDVLDPLEPTLTLHGLTRSAAAKKASKKGRGGGGAGGAATGHTDAVMGLAWNREHRHLLASASADTTVKLWDLDAGGKVLQSFGHHTDKVQSVAWNPVETTVMATAAYDGTAAVLDAREGSEAKVARYALPSDVEALTWNLHAPQCLLAACDNGTVTQYDVRSPAAPLWSIKAHTGAVTTLAQSPLARGMLATAGLDKTVRIWDTGAAAGADGARPVLVAAKEMTIGQIFTLSFFPQSPFMLAAGGSKGMLALWDVMADGGEVAGAPPLSPAAAAAAAAAAAGAGGDASLTAQRWADRMVAVDDMPAAQVRPRVDGQPTI